MMIFLGEPIQTNFGCSEAHRQKPLFEVKGKIIKIKVFVRLPFLKVLEGSCVICTFELRVCILEDKHKHLVRL